MANRTIHFDRRVPFSGQITERKPPVKESMSYVRGTTEQPLIHQTIGDLLQNAVDQWADKEAIVVRRPGPRRLGFEALPLKFSL